MITMAHVISIPTSTSAICCRATSNILPESCPKKCSYTSVYFNVDRLFFWYSEVKHICVS